MEENVPALPVPDFKYCARLSSTCAYLGKFDSMAGSLVAEQWKIMSVAHDRIENEKEDEA